MTTLSVIVPCYNIEAYVSDTVRSLVNNAREDFEFIFVEDCSRDRTSEALTALTAKLPHSTLLRHEQNRGLASARNTGIDRARGRYLTFLDGDDWLAPGHLAGLVEAIERLGVDFVRTDHVEVTGTDRVLKRAPEGRRDEVLDPRTGILPVAESTMVDYPYAWAGIYDTRLLEKGLLRFPDGLRTAEDRPWIWQLHRRAASYAVTPLHGVRYRRGVATSLTQVGDVRQLDFFRAFDQVMSELAHDPEAVRLRPKAIRTYAVVIAHQLRSRRRFERPVERELRRMAREALRAFPAEDLEQALVGLDDARRTILRKVSS
ncbi:glycosyltransferase family 2 protein [Streptomyces sp. HNM0663]|uniref:Glycosyltransferase family 2 protein n=1 Tax=Streptomyces chengmaiensis TaxID=3040919 RepID=A0ABT6HN67_9ACTN|nr:glycosyltransferase family 2 protein [Streptomyces chengmaiensis]MDH2389806.1 glycosyltransferase family 2 protein [Streptomyces chengmaiensis]